MGHRKSFATLIVFALVTLFFTILSPIQKVVAIPVPLLLPFSIGETWYICQGYNGPISHSTSYALDLSIDPGSPGSQGCNASTNNSSTGKAIIAPGAGEVYQGIEWDTIYINFDDGGSILFSHINHNWQPPQNANAWLGRVAAGEIIGTLNAPNARNGNYAHLHMMIFSGSFTQGGALPFDDANQTRFQCAPDMPYSGEINQYSGTALTRCEIVSGYIDAPINSTTITGTVLIGGWTKVESNTIDRVEIWIDGQYHTTATYGISRPDVGGNYGYQWLWDTSTVANGIHPIQVKAITANGGDTFLPQNGQTTIQVNIQNPSGYIDAPINSTTVTGTVLIGGWAKVESSTIDRVEIWIDGQYHTTATYGVSRPDVGGNYGYQWLWDTSTVANGIHPIQVKAIAANGGGTFLPQSGQTTIQVNVQNPSGYIDAPINSTMVTGTVLIGGWVKVESSTIDRVEIWIDGQYHTTATYGISRPDVGGNYGYQWLWDTNTVANGIHPIQVKAIAANGGGTFLPQSGQTTIQVNVQNSIITIKSKIFLPLISR